MYFLLWFVHQVKNAFIIFRCSKIQKCLDLHPILVFAVKR